MFAPGPNTTASTAILPLTAMSARRDAVRRFGADRGGAMAVEFAMVLFPLCILIFFILEGALVYWVSSALDNGLDSSMRQFYVQADSPESTLAGGVREELCRQVSPFVNCDKLKIDIAAYDSFSRIDGSSPLDASTGNWRAGFGEQHGCLRKGSVVVVQAALAQQTFQKFGVVKTQFKDGSRLILATAVLQLDGNSTSGAAC